jgi:hypothetical protein
MRFKKFKPSIWTKGIVLSCEVQIVVLALSGSWFVVSGLISVVRRHFEAIGITWDGPLGVVGGLIDVGIGLLTLYCLWQFKGKSGDGLS